MSPSWSAYEVNPAGFTDLYESLSFEQVHNSVLAFIPSTPLKVLDIGAGSGRDAAWFADRGHDVVACEPSPAMRRLARDIHPDQTIRWLPDALPDLPTLSRANVTFDLILLSGVWMHLNPSDRPRAFRKMAALLAPGGRLIISLRHGPADGGREFFQAGEGELESLGSSHGLACIHKAGSDDVQGRPGVRWSVLVFQLPDDATGSLPLLRGIILRDRRSSSYKLALLRVLCRIAELHPGLAKEGDGDSIELPLGLVALTWLRAYLPLFRCNLPQHPQPAKGFLGTLGRLHDLDPVDLRPGMTLAGEMAWALERSLAEAAETIRVNPANFIHYPGADEPIFSIRKARAPMPRVNGTLVLDEPTLWSFGSFRLPGSIWQTFCRFSPWVEPLLRQAWSQYMENLAGPVEGVNAWKALDWTDPQRNTAQARRLAEAVRARGKKVRCVWTGRELKGELEVDHCFPMAAWPCQDLWNLLPAAPSVNREKRDRLVSPERLYRAADRILEWWDDAYRQAADASIPARFPVEARTTLGLDPDRDPTLEEILAGVDLKRMVLGRSRELEIWS